MVGRELFKALRVHLSRPGRRKSGCPPSLHSLCFLPFFYPLHRHDSVPQPRRAPAPQLELKLHLYNIVIGGEGAPSGPGGHFAHSPTMSVSLCVHTCLCEFVQGVSVLSNAFSLPLAAVTSLIFNSQLPRIAVVSSKTCRFHGWFQPSAIQFGWAHSVDPSCEEATENVWKAKGSSEKQFFRS